MRGRAAFLGVWILPALLAAAGRSPVEQGRIDWLLAQIRDSKGVFIRNGAEYDCVKAANYLSEKLHFKGSRLATAREFIEKIASSSETTGRPYEIRLPGKEAVSLGPWLSKLLDEKENPPPAK